MLTIRSDLVPRIELAGFVSYRAPWLHFKRNTDDYIFYFVKSGELHLNEDGEIYRLKKGDALLLEPGLDHEGLEKHTCDYFYIHFKHPDIRRVDGAGAGELARRMLLEDAAATGQDGEAPRVYLPKFTSLAGKPYLHQALQALGEIKQMGGRRQYDRSLAALKFAELLIALGRGHLAEALAGGDGDGRAPKALVKVNGLLDYIHQHYARRITGEEIERVFDANFDYLNRIFKQTTGMPVNRYINRVRIGHAKELIRATPLGFAEIGYLTGLGDPYYFSKVFKKHAGMTPTEYAGQARGD